MTAAPPLLSYFLVLMLTLGTLCGPLLGLARLMEAGRVHEARRLQAKAEQDAHRRAEAMKLAAVKQGIAEKFANSALSRSADDAQQGPPQ